MRASSASTRPASAATGSSGRDRLAPLRQARPRPVHRLRALRADVRRGPGHVRAHAGRARLRAPWSRRAAAAPGATRTASPAAAASTRARPARCRSRACSTCGRSSDDARPPAATAASAARSTSTSATTRSSRSPRPRRPVNRGHACVKGRFAHGFVRSPDRLTTPLVRRDGDCDEASWDEALGLVGGELTPHPRRARAGRRRRRSPPRARPTRRTTWCRSSCGSSSARNNVDNCSRLCHSPSAAGLTATFGLSGGTNTVDDIDRADCFLLAGANPTEAHPVVGARIKQRGARAARGWSSSTRAASSSRATPTSTSQGRPGSNVAVFNGLAHVLLEEGYADEDVPRRARRRPRRAARGAAPTTRPSGSRRSPACRPTTCVRRRPALRRGRRAGDRLRARDHRARARHRRRAHPRQPRDPDRQRRHRARRRGQPAARPEQRPGRLGHGRAARPPARLPAGRRRGRPRERFEQRLGSRRSTATPGLRIPEMFDAALERRAEGPLRLRRGHRADRPRHAPRRGGDGACELVVSQEIFLSRTAERADVVLPAASFLEKDGTFVNFDRRFQRVRPALHRPARRGPTSRSSSCVARRSARTSAALRRPRRWTSAPAVARFRRHLPRAARPRGPAALAVPLARRPGRGRRSTWTVRDPERPGAARGAPVPAAGRAARRRLPVHADHRPAAGALQRRHDDPPDRNLGCFPRSCSRSTPTTPPGSGSRDGGARRGDEPPRQRSSSPPDVTERVAPGQVFMAFHFPRRRRTRSPRATRRPSPRAPSTR